MTVEARWRAAFLGYVLVQMVVRLLVGPSLELDEAEAFLHGQHLAWGYGPQPPLFYWLQWLLLQLFGDTMLAVAALKAALLGGILIGTFELLRQSVPTQAAGVATLSLSLLPQVVWESQRALANSVLTLALAVAAALLLLRVLRNRRWGDHLLWGALVGLGVLAKPNFAIWAAGLLLAAAVLPEWRGALRPGRLALAMVVALAMLAGPAGWAWANLEVATGSLDKFEVARSGLDARVAGSGSLLVAVLSFNAIGALVLGGVLAWGSRRGARAAIPPALRLLGLAAGLSLLLLWGGVLLTGATTIKDRWLMPFAWPLVPVAVAAIWPMLTPRASTSLGRIAGGAWIVAAALLPYASLVDPGYRGADWRPLAAALRDAGGDETPVATTSTLVGGNLAFHRFGIASAFLRSGEDVPVGSLLLVVPAASTSGVAPSIAARTLRAREVSVPRGTRPLRFTILMLKPA